LGIASILGNSHLSKTFSRKAAKTQRRKLVEILDAFFFAPFAALREKVLLKTQLLSGCR